MAELKVFLSSVSLGLKDTRSRLAEDLRKAGYQPLGMESFGAQVDPPIEVCLRELRSADIVVLIIGPRFGSLLPQGISYTQAEFREARSLGIPVVAFRVPTDPSLSPEDRERLTDFEQEVGSTALYEALSPSDSLERLSVNVLAALIKARERGILGRRYVLAQPAEQFFEVELTVAAIFNHVGPYVGRKDELRVASEFITTSSSPLLLVSAAGGSGKSRLLLETAKAVGSSPPVLFVDSGVPWSTDDIARLPTTPAVLVFDDAHRRADLDRLVAACRIHNDKARFIVCYRPGASEFVRSLLSRTLGVSDPIRLELSPLCSDDALSLARYHLGSAFDGHASRLVALANRNPLVISVGGRCIAKHRVSPDVLQRTPEEFTREVLDRLLEDPELSRHDASIRQAILAVLSAIGPAQTESSVLIKAFAAHVAVHEYELRRLLGELERAGLLARRGRMVRVTPDVLADHLLYRAALDANGTPTRFVETMLKEFGATSLENILGNAAELDWRGGRENASDAVLSGTWRDLLNLLPGATYSQRAELLGKVKRAAMFAPREALKLADWLSDNPVAPPDQRLLEWGLKDTSHAVTDALVDLYSLVAGHAELTQRCLARLWPIAAADSSPANPGPEHPRRRLEVFLKYERAFFWKRDDGVQVRTIHFFCEKLRDPARKEGASWAVDLLKAALERLGEDTESTRKQITIRSFSLAPFIPNLAPRRREVLSCLQDVALGPRPEEAGSAVQRIAALLQTPWGPFGQALDAKDLGAECLAHTKSELHGVATSGVYSGAAGEPMPRHLAEKSDGERLSKLYASRPSASEFFRELVERAEDSIRRHEQSWDEEGDE